MATHPSRAKPPKPCKCGSEPEIVEIHEGFYVLCPDGCDRTWPPTPHKYIAVRTWNARKT